MLVGVDERAIADQRTAVREVCAALPEAELRAAPKRLVTLLDEQAG
jgi:hypothetical protein